MPNIPVFRRSTRKVPTFSFPCFFLSSFLTPDFPHLYNSSPISEDPVYDGLSFIGESYKKYIELFNHCYEQHYPRNFSHAFFDCTNYYFEIDLPCEDKQKGPSKENRHAPIIGQVLLLDADLVPVAMQMYPGNESEKPYIRKMIEKMKRRYQISGNRQRGYEDFFRGRKKDCFLQPRTGKKTDCRDPENGR